MNKQKKSPTTSPLNEELTYTFIQQKSYNSCFFIWTSLSRHSFLFSSIHAIWIFWQVEYGLTDFYCIKHPVHCILDFKMVHIIHNINLPSFIRTMWHYLQAPAVLFFCHNMRGTARHVMCCYYNALSSVFVTMQCCRFFSISLKCYCV